MPDMYPHKLGTLVDGNYVLVNLRISKFNYRMSFLKQRRKYVPIPSPVMISCDYRTTTFVNQRFIFRKKINIGI